MHVGWNLIVVNFDVQLLQLEVMAMTKVLQLKQKLVFDVPKSQISCNKERLV